MSAPPLVAHIIYSLSTGGLENGLINIINRCPPERYRHAIICITSADDFSQRITAPCVEVYQLHKREGHDLACYWRLRKLLSDLQPAIIHSRNLAALEMQLCGLALFGQKRVHGEHGREINDVDGSNRKYLLFRRFMRFFIDRYIAVSQDLERWLESQVHVPACNVVQIYNGVDWDKFSPQAEKPRALLPPQWRDRSDLLVVGTVGRLTPVKDQRTLLIAVRSILDRDPQWRPRLRLLLVGDGPLRAELEQLIERLGLRDITWLAGDRKDVAQLLGVMDVFVLPSLGEGISNTVLEAQASGLPVVATAVGGNVELVEEGVNGVLFSVGDSGSLSQHLTMLLSDEQTRRSMGERGRARVIEHFDWQRTVSDYLGVYDDLLGNGPTANTQAGD